MDVHRVCKEKLVKRRKKESKKEIKMTDNDITKTCGKCNQVYAKVNNLCCNLSKKLLKEIALGDCPKANDKSKKRVSI